MRRPLLPVVAAAVALLLSGCAGTPLVVPTATPEPTGAAVAAAEHQDDRAFGGARVEDDRAGRALVVVPKRSNGAVVEFLHGWNQNRWTVLRGRERVVRALVESGYTVLTADAGLRAWGDPASVEDYRRLLHDAQRRFHLSDAFLIGESMGGLATMQLARQEPAVRAVVAWYPVCDLRTIREARFQPSIDAAWHGLDRRRVSPVAAPDRPMLVWASPHDTVVDAATNAALCVREDRRAGRSAALLRSSGNHADPSNFQPAAVLRFFGRYRTPGA